MSIKEIQELYSRVKYDREQLNLVRSQLARDTEELHGALIKFAKVRDFIQFDNGIIMEVVTEAGGHWTLRPRKVIK